MCEVLALFADDNRVLASADNCPSAPASTRGHEGGHVSKVGEQSRSRSLKYLDLAWLAENCAYPEAAINHHGSDTNLGVLPVEDIGAVAR